MNDCVNSIAEGIKNYIEMPHSGALMISGPWGCGKTYYYDHTIVPFLKNNQLFPIKISLFGITDINDVYDKIKEEYYCSQEAINEEKTKINKSIYRLLDKYKDLIDEAGKAGKTVNDKYDIRKYANLLFRFRSIPVDKVIICFDDLERAIRSIDNVDILLGMINELVENRHFRVLIIANEQFIQQHNSSSLQFKEKVVEKTLYYEPDIKTIFFEIAEEITKDKPLNDEFSSLIHNPIILESINPYSISHSNEDKLKENLINLRNLKFTLSHFYKVFSAIAQTGEPLSDSEKEMLLYAWLFSLGITIAYKNNQLTDNRIRSLIQYPQIANTVASIDFGEDSQIDTQSLFQDEDLNETARKEMEEIEKDSNKYAKTFYNTFIKPYWEKIIWVEPLFRFLTKGINFSSEELKESLSFAIIEKDSENPASNCINGFLQHYRTLPDNDFETQLKAVHSYLSKGELTGYMDYLNASFFLLRYKDILGVDDKVIKDDITKGIQCFSERCKSQPIIRSSMEMVKSDIDPSVHWVYGLIMECIRKREEQSHAEDINQLNNEFSKGDMASFCGHFCVFGQGTETQDYITKQVLNEMDLDMVKSSIQMFQAPQLSLLDHMLKFRFIQQIAGNAINYSIEIPFIMAIKEGLSNVDYSKPKYSNEWMHHLDSTVTRIIKQHGNTE